MFLKGCPLSCLWCHNPESLGTEPETFFSPEKCIGCKHCANVCQTGCHRFENGVHIYARDACVSCGACTRECPTAALEKVGTTVSVEEVMAEVVKDKAFYVRSGGGTTVSGGEAMMQFEFTREFLKQAKEFGLHTCIETSGAGAAAQFAEISRHVDIFLYDIKATDPKLHEQLTGVSSTRIVENIMMLDEMGANIILRCPIVPNLNDGREHFEGIARLGNQLKHIVEIHVLPYNVLGISKSRRLGKDATYDETEMPNDKQTEQWLSAIEESTRVKVRKT